MSAALARVRSEGTSGNLIEDVVKQAVRAVARALVEQTEGIRPLPAALVRTIRDGADTYFVRGSFLDGHAGVPTVVVRVERGACEPAAAEEIRHTLGLTRKQAIVARLLAAGFTNTRIAAELSISEHTARHHTENIMARLGCRTRSGVADAVFGVGG